MNHHQLQTEILNCLWSEQCKENIAAQNYIFTAEELLCIAYRFAPSFEERLRLMTLLADHAPDVSEHAKRCISWQKACLERFQTANANEVYELRIKDEPDAYEERYLCASYQAALDAIDGYYKEYDFAKESPLARYVIEKRKILQSGEAFQEDGLGECTFTVGKVLVDVPRKAEETENGMCAADCDACPNPCLFRSELFFPICIPDRAPVRFLSWDGTVRYGINLSIGRSDKTDEYYIIPMEGELIQSENYEEHWGGHWHEHIPCPEAESISPEELPPQFQEQYHNFLAWLNANFSEDYKRRNTEKEVFH